MLLLIAKITLIRAKVTGTPKTTTNKGVVDREVKVEVEVAKVEAIRAKISHVRTKFRRTILRTSY